MTVELVYDSDCPNIQATRENLLRAFSNAHFPARWTEWERSSSACPARLRNFGSPTVLIDGRDVADQEPTGASCCRLYPSTNGPSTGAPSPYLIYRGISRVVNSQRPPWRRHLAVLVGIGIALLPKLTCPLCWPAYASLLSTLGVGFLVSAEYLLTTTAVSLLVAVGALLFRAKARRGYGPSILGAGAAAAVLLGKFQFESTVAAYGGLTLLAAASLWNSWPRKVADACSQCAPAGDVKEFERRGESQYEPANTKSGSV